MPLKVTWRKGMRLSTDVFDAADAACAENVRLASLIASGGRYGLFPAAKPFELSVNISNNILEVVSLSCHGITGSGRLVDIEFNSNYTVTFDTRLTIPAAEDTEAFILTVKMHPGVWREVSEMYSEPMYTFELLGENTVIDNDSLPIGRVVNQYGWRLDETEFVPPCLYVDAHRRYAELLDRVKAALKGIADRCLEADNCVARHLLSSIWTATSSGFITLDKERQTLTPARLLAVVQQTVSAFVIGCAVDSYITLENATPFVSYVRQPYDARNIYRDIESGLALCAEIAIKMEAVCGMTEVKEAPVEKPKPRPQPAPAPEPQPAPGRNRWEGIEI